MSRKIKELELYIHIPFCKSKCAYCDFLSSSKHLNETDTKKYLDQIQREIDYYGEVVKKDKRVNYKVSSIFIGGGTPSTLDISDIKTIVTALKSKFKFVENPEITIEVNPESVTLLKAKCYYDIGINRVSIGLQSIHEGELNGLGRIHTYNDFKDALFLIRNAKIKNINVDLMYGIPNQTLDSWEETLKAVAKEPVTHISAYSLILEEGTRFYERKDEIEKLLPDEDTVIEMGKTCEDILKSNDFKRYEISNYSKKDMECKHNLGYWSMKEYIGMGLGASSYFKGERYHNTKEFDEYVLCDKFENIKILEREKNVNKDMEEFMFLGLRKTKGITKEDFKEEFGIDIQSVFGETIDKYINLNMIKEDDDRLYLTKKGIDISNDILCDFLLV